MNRLALFVVVSLATLAVAVPAFACGDYAHSAGPVHRVATGLTKQVAANEFSQFARVKKTRGAGNTIGQWAKSQTSTAAGNALAGMPLTSPQTQMDATALVAGLDSVR
jgi:hypothetical protein